MTNINNLPKLDDLPKSRELERPTLVALDKLDGSATTHEINDKIAEMFSFSDEVLALTYDMYGRKTPLPIMYNRCSWARSDMKSVGLLESGGHGIWTLTEKGKQSLSWSDDEFAKFCKEHKIRARVNAEDEETTKDEAWRGELLAVLQKMDPYAFERLAKRLLLEAGFDKVEVRGGSGDGGIDGKGVMQINLLSFPVLFQCKRYQGVVGAGTVRDFRGAMVGESINKGLIITTGKYTRQSRDEAARNSMYSIELIDGEELCDLLKKKKLGVAVETETVEHVTVQEGWFDQFEKTDSTKQST